MTVVMSAALRKDVLAQADASREKIVAKVTAMYRKHAQKAAKRHKKSDRPKATRATARISRHITKEVGL